MNYLSLITLAILLVAVSCNRPQAALTAEQPAPAEQPTAPAEPKVEEDASTELATDKVQGEQVERMVDRYGRELELTTDQRATILEMAEGYDLYGGSREEQRQARRAFLQQVEGSVLTAEQVNRAKELRRWNQGGGK